MDKSAKIYDVSWFGCGVKNNGSTNWGKVYSWWSNSSSALENC